MVEAATSSDEPPRRSQTELARGRLTANVDIADPERRLGADALRWLSEMAHRALDAMGAAGEVRVRIVGDGPMAAAHERYKGMSGTTDVLTFDLSEPARGAGPAGGPVLDVDILICADEAARRGAEFGHAPERELLLYIVHGVLHCLGHDDGDDEAAARMHRAEDEVLARIGAGATYRPASPADAPARGA